MPLRLRERAFSSLERLRLLDVLLRGRAHLPRQSLVVLNYHRVQDQDTGLDDGVVSATAAGFYEQVLLVARHARAVTIDDIGAALRGERALPKNAVLLTFDDGYRDNHDVALPILQKLGVPATFFVTTGYVGQRCLPWWDRIGYVLRRSTAPELHLRYPTEQRLSMSGAARAQTQRVLLRLIKQSFGLDFARFFAELEQAAGVTVDEAALTDGLFMSWDEVRALHRAGMDIGAHTKTHRVLQTIPLEEARDEIAGSRQEIAAQLGFAPRAIAYPVGHPLSQESGLRGLVAEAGFEIGFTFVKGLIDLGPRGRGAIDPLNLPRLSVDREDRIASARFKAALGAPQLLL